MAELLTVIYVYIPKVTQVSLILIGTRHSNTLNPKYIVKTLLFIFTILKQIIKYVFITDYRYNIVFEISRQPKTGGP